MKKIINFAVALLLSVAMLGGCTKEGPAGKDGRNGRDGKDGLNGSSIITGTGVPLPDIGNKGDFYLNLDNTDFYGPKTDGGWGTPISLRGLKGDQGNQGPKGDTGAPGANGQNGTNGEPGTKFYAGTGAPNTNTGREGDFYIDLQSKKIYGPKTNSGWGNGIDIISD